MGEESVEGVEFRVLGSVDALHEGSRLRLGGPRHRRLLAVLLVHAGEVVPTDRLIDALWGSSVPRSAPQMVHVRVSELRAALRAGQPELLTQGGGYLLRVDDDSLDARRFERLAADGSHALADGDAARARAQLALGLALWRGAALAEFADEPFARAEAVRLTELRHQAVENRIAADLQLGRHAGVVAELETLVAEHPLRERFWAQLMVALYRAGRQGEALEAYHTVRRLTADQLGVEPGAELRRIQAAILRHDPELEPRPTAARRIAGNLPSALTSFVGRRRDVVAIRGLLRTRRLVTLAGVGGAGKSRLAVEVASACRSDFRHGTWLVELASVPQPNLVPSAIATTLGIREHARRPLLDIIVDYLATTEALLVLDGCEHVLDEVARVAERLLERCPDLRIIVTSRERLGITGEAVRRVGGLGVPPAGVTGVRAVVRADAVRLLVERVRAVQPDFEVTAAVTGRLADICRRLDGLPLALELAAASISAWGVDQTAGGVHQPFQLLTRGSRTAPARHRSLRAVVDWSYRLLDHRQRALFDRLSVFVGGFTVDAAVAVSVDVADGEAGVLDGLARLVDKSLVVIDRTDPATTRYSMLETLRAYAAERLVASGAAAAVRTRHAAYTLQLVRSARGQLHGRARAMWLRRVAAETGNLRAALAWSIDQRDAATAVRLAGLLYPVWERNGLYHEGRRWLERALAMEAPVVPAIRALALESQAGLAAIQGDLAAATRAVDEAVALSRQVGDRVGVARAMTTAGLIAIYTDDLDRAVTILDEALRHAEGRRGGRWPAGYALLYLAYVATAREEYEQARKLLEECESHLRAVGELDGLARALMVRAVITWRTGDQAEAAELLRQGLHHYEGLSHCWVLALGLGIAAELYSTRGDHERAIALLSASQALRDPLGVPLMPLLAASADLVTARAGAALEASATERARRAGRSAPADRVLADAVRDL
ncbi:BTAD domain-containing putative transcriptional regulator [Jiangella ureilytica]|nr:BTAD domain-containing putative transcriptional regulator [Jiangella ureilytica]